MCHTQQTEQSHAPPFFGRAAHVCSLLKVVSTVIVAKLGKDLIIYNNKLNFIVNIIMLLEWNSLIVT
jgi:hypothetical protein